MEEYDLFQSQDGGSIPTSPLQYKIRACSFSDIRSIFEKFHYKKGHMGGGITICYCLIFEANIHAGAVVGKLRHDKKYSQKHRCLELRRLACLDKCPKNTESYFLSKIIWAIRKKKIADELISYSDTSVGHMGTIYKAANFKLIGRTGPSKHIFWNGERYHPRSLTINRPYSDKLRKAVKSGEAKIETGGEKLIFSYNLS